jgi:hypothetical protein
MPGVTGFDAGALDYHFAFVRRTNLALNSAAVNILNHGHVPLAVAGGLNAAGALDRRHGCGLRSSDVGDLDCNCFTDDQLGDVPAQILRPFNVLAPWGSPNPAKKFQGSLQHTVCNLDAWGSPNAAGNFQGNFQHHVCSLDVCWSWEPYPSNVHLQLAVCRVCRNAVNMLPRIVGIPHWVWLTA